MPGCLEPWATPFYPFLAKIGGSRWAYFFFAIFFPVRAATNGLYGSQYRRSRLALLHASKRLDVVFLLVVQEPISRVHYLSAPTEEPLRRFQQQDVQPSLARLATEPHLLCTYALDAQASKATVVTPFTAVHAQSVVHAPPYWALMQQILSHG